MRNTKNIVRRELVIDIVITLAVVVLIGGLLLASLAGIEWLATTLAVILMLGGLAAGGILVLGSLLGIAECL